MLDENQIMVWKTFFMCGKRDIVSRYDQVRWRSSIFQRKDWKRLEKTGYAAENHGFFDENHGFSMKIIDFFNENHWFFSFIPKIDFSFIPKYLKYLLCIRLLLCPRWICFTPNWISICLCVIKLSSKITDARWKSWICRRKS